MNDKKPKFITDRMDVKAATVNMFARSIEIFKKPNPESPFTFPQDTKVFILTNFGIVESDIDFSNNEDKKASTLINETLLDLRKDAWSNLSESTVVTNNSAVVVIQNAKVKPFENPNNISNFEVLNLFSDQIVGFSFGSTASEDNS